MVIVFIHNVMTKRPKAQGCEKGGMKWSEVVFFGEMCVLSLIDTYVAVCSVQYVVSLLFVAVCYFIYSYVAVCI